MTPYEIEIILHHACSHAEFHRHHAPGYLPTVEGLVSQGILEKCGEQGVYAATELGQKYVKMLCGMPLPFKKWFNPCDMTEIGDE